MSASIKVKFKKLTNNYFQVPDTLFRYDTELNHLLVTLFLKYYLVIIETEKI